MPLVEHFSLSSMRPSETGTKNMLHPRFLLKILSWLLSWPRRYASKQVVILMYHRVTGDTPLELDLPFPVFRAQMLVLAKMEQVVSLDEAVRRLESGEVFNHPIYVITFDDAFKDFYTHAFPLLRDLGLPVTLYVPTGFLDSPDTPPISRNVSAPEKLQPITWAMLSELVTNPLVTIASHTHSHFELPFLSDAEILDELDRCDSLLQERLGQPMRHFAYPRGVWNDRVELLVKDRYATIALADGGAIKLDSFFRYRIPRVPALRSDGMRWFNARISGRLIYEERFVKFVKRLKLKLMSRLHKW